MNYQKGFQFTINEKDVSKEDMKELKKIISNFLIKKGYINPRIHQNGFYNKNLEPIWENCKDIK